MSSLDKLGMTLQNMMRAFSSLEHRRILIVGVFGALISAAIGVRLFVLQIINHSFYEAVAAGAHDLQKVLEPKRGEIFLRDLKNAEALYTFAINEDRFQVFAEPKKIFDPSEIARKVADVLGQKGEARMETLEKMQKKDDPFEIIARSVDEDTVDRLRALKLVGIGFLREPHRFYPETKLGSQAVGFVDRQLHGQYGLEGYFNDLLRGTPGSLKGEKGGAGGVLTFGSRELVPAQDGARIVTTIDKTIEFFVCDALRRGAEEYKAVSGSAIVLEPRTGAILALCNVPDFNPNAYNEVKDLSVFNNSAIFTPYEPGSVFKAFTMAAALDTDTVTPDTKFTDTGSVTLGDRTIKNAGEKKYGERTMTEVLVNSINTGIVYVVRQIGRDIFKKYVENFGFGTRTGVEMDKENAGTIASLGERGEIFTATASFGQGITVTPLQLAAAYGAIANGGKLMKPQIVSEIRYSDGRVERRAPKEVRQVISVRTARLLSGMLAAVVREGSAKRAAVPGYFVAGKTGTAQIPSQSGGYEEDTIHTFAGFAPVDDPRFVVVVKYDRPQRKYAESTAVPVAGEINKFLLQYLEVPPDEVKQ